MGVPRTADLDRSYSISQHLRGKIATRKDHARELRLRTLECPTWTIQHQTVGFLRYCKELAWRSRWIRWEKKSTGFSATCMASTKYAVLLLINSRYSLEFRIQTYRTASATRSTSAENCFSFMKDGLIKAFGMALVASRTATMVLEKRFSQSRDARSHILQSDSTQASRPKVLE